MLTETTVRNILTRTSGYLATVTSHSLQPYRGCSYGRSLCGVGCYVQHNPWITQGRTWGEFLEVRVNAAESYRANVTREANWARRTHGRFSIFLSSSTDPCVPQEQKYGITRSLLTAMLDHPPDLLIVQTHSHQVVHLSALLLELSGTCAVRVHVSIETDRNLIPGLPPPASTVEQRLLTCRALKQLGLTTIVTVAPLLPIADPERFFSQIAEAAHGVILDHYIQGDGSPDGSRTARTSLPAAIQSLQPEALSLSYRAEMAKIAEQSLPGRVEIHIAGFAGQWLE